MNCKDNCLHYEVCAQFSKADGANHEYYDFSNQAEKCECFKDCHRGINDERLICFICAQTIFAAMEKGKMRNDR